jgi:hypothetical protein
MEGRGRGCDKNLEGVRKKEGTGSKEEEGMHRGGS